jgi:FtsP/CotA-like multicopper oxidase with cupredoxin domain
MVIRFRAVPSGATDLFMAGAPMPFYVIGSDQGLASDASMTDTLVFEPGGRYDIVFDFSQVPMNSRVIMENIGGDAPFGGDFGDELEHEDLFPYRQTDRIMAFDVVLPLDELMPNWFDPSVVAHFGGNTNAVDHTRKVALFEGKDEFGRLQPLLGIVDDEANAFGSMATPYAWFEQTTEMPGLDSTEIWQIYNFTEDAHPIHLHLVNFEILGRNGLSFRSDEGEPGQPVNQHNGTQGRAPIITRIRERGPVKLKPKDGYVENAPKDLVTALPGQVTRIKATFDKPGRYVWHCHILSHEDHEMMRVLQVG